MLFSGADIVKNSGESRQRFQRLAGTVSESEPVQPVSPPPSHERPHLEDSKNALLRLVKFMEHEKENRRESQDPPHQPARPKSRRDLPRLHQRFLFEGDLRGQVIDIYA